MSTQQLNTNADTKKSHHFRRDKWYGIMLSCELLLCCLVGLHLPLYHIFLEQFTFYSSKNLESGVYCVLYMIYKISIQRDEVLTIYYICDTMTIDN